MMVIFLVGLVTMILMRTLRKDYARYSKEEDLDDMERDLGDEYGWKQVWFSKLFFVGNSILKGIFLCQGARRRLQASVEPALLLRTDRIGIPGIFGGEKIKVPGLMFVIFEDRRGHPVRHLLRHPGRPLHRVRTKTPRLPHT